MWVPAVTTPLVDIEYESTTFTTPVLLLGMLPPTPQRRIENGLPTPAFTDVGNATFVLRVVAVSSVVSAQAGCISSSSAPKDATIVRASRRVVARVRPGAVR